MVNLLSINQLIGFVTSFPTYCVFQDLSTKKTIGSGHLVNGVYQLDKSHLFQLPFIPQMMCYSSIVA